MTSLSVVTPVRKCAAIALGSNLGDSERTLDAAVDALAALPGTALLRRSVWHRTTPVGPSSPTFLNGAVLLETALAAHDLLASLHEIESRLGRIRTERWSARTLDLDLLYLGDEVHSSPTLRLPHPAAFYRRFVLDPLVEISPDWVDPIRQASVRELRARLLDRPLCVAILGDGAASLAHTLSLEYPGAEFTGYRSVECSPFAVEGDLDGDTLPALIVDLTGLADLEGRGAMAAWRSRWLDLWGHQTTALAMARDAEATAARVREVLGSALGA